ncbi:MAG: flagellar biosynthesis protein FlaG, partial [Clostridia bacterium]|nr:flagellar biosynthesis protein FlaG [Clostridia bacterium]
VIYTIPPDRVFHMLARLREAVGLVVDQKV